MSLDAENHLFRVEAEAEPFASEHEIAEAIIKRIAHNEGDSWKTACELAAILKECAIPYTDLYNGMREQRREL